MSRKINISIKVVINKIKYIGKLYTDINFTVMYEYKTLKIKFKHKYKLLANLTLNSIKNTSYIIYFILISYNTMMILYFDIFLIFLLIYILLANLVILETIKNNPISLNQKMRLILSNIFLLFFNSFLRFFLLILIKKKHKNHYKISYIHNHI